MSNELKMRCEMSHVNGREARACLAPRLSSLAPFRAFTLIELIGVLGIMSVLAAAVIVNVIRRMDRAAWTKETADLDTLAVSLTQSIIGTKTVPDAGNCAAAIAARMSQPVSVIATNARRLARAFVVDPNLRINGAVLPYSQTSTGSTGTASPRLMIVSSLARALPISTGIPSSTEFNAMWNAAEGVLPATATWTNWAGTGEDLRIRKVNLDPLFYQLILVDHDN